MNKVYSRLLLVLLAILISCGTTEGFLIAEQPYSLQDIRRAIGAIAGKPRSLSANQREVLSAYFARKPTPNFDPEKAKERLYAHFWILGDRRPYDVRVLVISEKRTADGYSEGDEEVALSEKIGNELRSKLVESQDPGNVIDNFRPY